MKFIYATTAIAVFSAGTGSAQQLTYGDFSADYTYLTDTFDEDIEHISLNINYEFGSRARIDDTFEKNVIDDENAVFGKVFFLTFLP